MGSHSLHPRFPACKMEIVIQYLTKKSSGPCLISCVMLTDFDPGGVAGECCVFSGRSVASLFSPCS